MKENSFFDFDSKSISTTIQAGTIDLKKDKNGIHQEYNLIRGKYIEISFPVHFRQVYGKNLTDILNTGWASLHLISDRMKSILQENHLSGWKDYPIKLYDKKGNEISGYNGFSVVGRCNAIDYKKAVVIEKSSIPGGPLSAYYKSIQVDNWDGTDFFSPLNSYQIIISGRAADILKRNKITNMHLVNLVEYEILVRHADMRKSTHGSATA